MLDLRKIDCRFKHYMRQRLQDRKYAEKIMQYFTELHESVLVDVWPHAALPYPYKNDPEAMIALIKGHDQSDETDFLLAIFGNWDSCKDVVNVYPYLLWNMYNPEANDNWGNLPVIYATAFIDAGSENEILHIRTVGTASDGTIISTAIHDGFIINLINYGIDSDMIKYITGHRYDVTPVKV